MLAVLPSILHVRTFGVRTWCKSAQKSVCSLLMSTQIRHSASIDLLVRLSVVEAAQKQVFPPWTNKHGHGLKNTDGLAWSP